ncbi:DNA-binding protein [Muribaculum intestinale]|jgi:excisionase family DNA binding protein|uniref:helix-turn-helix transcriptional regulator n=1 Tax=Muribaculum intestinale TaxID=1796646 RepID=UPI001093EDF4|nr:helix-turn-helix domain-containing protein [Muribaculum intestinale]TGX84434.1 DNA-binding protein [Muribaculum intestinale]
MNLYNLLQASLSDPNSPNILLTVSLSDLHQLVVDTIDATRDRLLPLFMKAEEDRLLTKAEVCAKLGIKPTSVWNLVQKGKLTVIKVGRSSRYKLSEVNVILDAKND